MIIIMGKLMGCVMVIFTRSCNVTIIFYNHYYYWLIYFHETIVVEVHCLITNQFQSNRHHCENP